MHLPSRRFAFAFGEVTLVMLRRGSDFVIPVSNLNSARVLAIASLQVRLSLQMLGYKVRKCGYLLPFTFLIYLVSDMDQHKVALTRIDWHLGVTGVPSQIVHAPSFQTSVLTSRRDVGFNLAMGMENARFLGLLYWRPFLRYELRGLTMCVCICREWSNVLCSSTTMNTVSIA